MTLTALLRQAIGAPALPLLLLAARAGSVHAAPPRHSPVPAASVRQTPGECDDSPEKPPTPATAPQPAAPKWRSLFDGKSLAGWKGVEFGGEGEVYVKQGEMWLDMGDTLTGATYQGEVPKTNYEIRLEAKRAGGIDFFCGLTFPVADSHCSFIVGGWAGAVVGLSSIDGHDASDNDTTRFMSFKDNQWYKIRVRVTDKHIQAWIDDQQVVSQDIRGKRISTRPEVNLNRPLGLCAWQTKAALRNLQLRALSPAEAQAAATPVAPQQKEKGNE